MLVRSIPTLSSLCLWLSSVALAQQRECDRDGTTSTYNLGGLTVPFDNFCGENITAALSYSWTSEQRRSDCIGRCVKKAPLCYGFNYSPYIDLFQANCILMKDSVPASNVTKGDLVADAATLNPEFIAQLPDDCKTLGLRGCFEKYGRLGTGTADLATSTASSSSSTTSTTAAPSTGSGDLTREEKIGIGAGLGGAAGSIAILCVVWFVRRCVKRKRATGSYNTVQQSNNGDTHQPHGADAATGGLELASTSPGIFEANAEPFHEIGGRSPHELRGDGMVGFAGS